MIEVDEKIVYEFKVKGKVKSLERYGCGHINDTYLLITQDENKENKYILQRINDKIFKEVDKLMNNITLVTEYARKKITKNGGNPERETLNLIKTTDGKSYYYNEVNGGYYRVYKFIENAVTYQVVEKPEHFTEAAKAFGDFAKLLAGFDATKIYEIIPKFHDTRKRYNDFINSVKADKTGRAKDVQKEIDFCVKREYYCDKIVSLLKSGEMPLKVTHNDTKLNNVMLDSVTGKYVCVIDLDTIMPGSICYDFGDSIRFGCNTANEDEKDLSKVNFDINLFEAYTKGYLSSLGDSVSKVEKDNLALGAILMTLECGMRFLADYLDGDTYFKVHREGHNLDRARTQFKLVEDMEKQFTEMNKIVNKY